MIEISTELFSKIYRLGEHISEKGVIEKDAYVVPIHKDRLDTLFAELKQLLKKPKVLKQRCLVCFQEWKTEKSVCPRCGGRLTPFTFAGR